MSSHPGLADWHDYMQSGGDLSLLAALVGEDAVFHSPVVHTSQVGKAKVMAYLGAASVVLGNDSFRYVRELVDGDDVLLEFTAEIDGIHVNGIDLIRFDGASKIADFKVMVRPLKAVNKLWEMMAAQLQAKV
jgi:SnoaL-like domain